MKETYSLDNINSIAKKVIELVNSKVVLFYGNMGVGKTTLIKEICKELNVDDPSHSPTFSLVNEYITSDKKTIYHFDFYRIEDEEEAYDMGIEDYLYSGNWCLIEWPDHIKNLLPINSAIVNISITDNHHRSIEIEEISA